MTFVIILKLFRTGLLLKTMSSLPDPKEGPADNREKIYRDLHNRLEPMERQNHISARKVMSLLFEQYKPHSVLDVGCGLGTWLSAARELGVETICGIEGQWLDLKQLRIEPEYVIVQDLEQPFDLDRSFDLVMSLEVAEHLSAAAARSFISSLTAHGDVILFSAAIPHQGGHNHINEQFPSYWAGIFAGFDFIPLDFIRGRIWDDGEIFLWIRQNILLFVRREIVLKTPAFAQYINNYAPLSIVHPDLFIERSRRLDQLSREHNKIMEDTQHIMMLDGFIQLYDKFSDIASRDGTYIVESKNGELFVKEVKED
jgi:SAM-dependent methyltransferase